MCPNFRLYLAVHMYALLWGDLKLADCLCVGAIFRITRF